MTPSEPDESADSALRGICARPAALFGQRLLERVEGRTISFPSFVATARELVSLWPEETATYLAALIALDMRQAFQPCPLHLPRSSN
jgi:hypothetical protein